MEEKIEAMGTDESVQVKRVSKKARVKCLLNWLFYAHACYNYERLQGTGFLHAMSPIINDLYDKDDKKGRSEALQRHTAFFNSEVRTGSAIVGICASMEERIASGETQLAEEAMPSIKYGLMGPLAGIGDTFIQAILSPLLLSLALGLAQNGNVMGPILYLFAFIGAIIFLGLFSFNLGYKKGDEAIMSFIESGVINKIIEGASIMGCVVMGALVASFVSLKTTLAFELPTGVFDLQANFFDVIMPCILPLILTVVVYKRMDKGDSALKMLLILIAAGLIFGLLGII